MSKRKEEVVCINLGSLSNRFATDIGVDERKGVDRRTGGLCIPVFHNR
jgi:hypothetical protein